MIDYDAELRLHHQALLPALDVRHTDRVLDIGCGSGQTTRDVALIASDGGAVGIDTAEHALRQARQRTLAAGLCNVDYICGDAARPPLPPESIDLAISGFGTMFFADPVPAFASIRGVLRPAGRLVMMVWQAARHNTWAVSIHRALVDDDTAWPETPAGPSAFSLGDTRMTGELLLAAAFGDIAFAEVRKPVYYGADVASAMEFVSRFSTVTSALRAQSAAEQERTLERLRDVMAYHLTPDGVWFDSRAWIVTARCGAHEPTTR
jgi:SAM-dependent methyltransferase